jgi:hypothetical protein
VSLKSFHFFEFRYLLLGTVVIPSCHRPWREVLLVLLIGVHSSPQQPNRAHSRTTPTIPACRWAAITYSHVPGAFKLGDLMGGVRMKKTDNGRDSESRAQSIAPSPRSKQGKEQASKLPGLRQHSEAPHVGPDRQAPQGLNPPPGALGRQRNLVKTSRRGMRTARGPIPIPLYSKPPLSLTIWTTQPFPRG